MYIYIYTADLTQIHMTFLFLYLGTLELLVKRTNILKILQR